MRTGIGCEASYGQTQEISIRRPIVRESSDGRKDERETSYVGERLGSRFCTNSRIKYIRNSGIA